VVEVDVVEVDVVEVDVVEVVLDVAFRWVGRDFENIARLS